MVLTGLSLFFTHFEILPLSPISLDQLLSVYVCVRACVRVSVCVADLSPARKSLQSIINHSDSIDTRIK